ncbi:MAG TPA: diguanylate cyclase [Tepidisphaeraceae bacterium]|jgi:PleD family two-component response regulator|nr:diguanylate cyclase [Tepidisphaeraceae bacterium]
MSRLGPERVLLIGDSQKNLQGALAQAMPSAHITSVPDYFEAIAELAGNQYTAVLASAEPIERRPEAAVRTLREMAADARVILFGHPTLEPLSRKMLDFGCDDYVITPTTPGELTQIFSTPHMRIAPAPVVEPATDAQPSVEPMPQPLLAGLPLASLFLGAISDQPHAAPTEAVKRLNLQLGPSMQLIYQPMDVTAPTPPDGKTVLSHGVKVDDEESGQLHLLIPRDEDANAARHLLAHLADLIGKLHSLQERHNRLQKLAITDELTGLYNARYFKHFLSRIIDRARSKLFPVTLLIFDIDNFKKYNDEFGHGVGDEILKQTAALIRRCCREHDLVARLGGDEFAVVFWEKDGPRQPKDPQQHGPSRPPQAVELIFARFKKLLATHELQALGPSGRGLLTISAGLAVYPWQASTMDELIDLADKRLMFGAKKAGKNSIVLVGGEPDRPQT